MKTCRQCFTTIEGEPAAWVQRKAIGNDPFCSPSCLALFALEWEDTEGEERLQNEKPFDPNAFQIEFDHAVAPDEIVAVDIETPTMRDLWNARVPTGITNQGALTQDLLNQVNNQILQQAEALPRNVWENIRFTREAMLEQRHREAQLWAATNPTTGYRFNTRWFDEDEEV